MFTMFEAELGDIKIAKVHVTAFRNSPSEENEIYIIVCDNHQLLGRTEIPKGKVSITQMVKVPASCPHCQKELPHGFARFDDLKDFETFTYHGAVVKGMTRIEETDYDGWKIGELVELRIKYETLEYKNHITNQIMVLNVTKEKRIEQVDEGSQGAAAEGQEAYFE